MKWTKFDTRWMLSLFGTAIGAGILFLPIKAGVGGFPPVVVMTFLIFPMVWLSHRSLSRFVGSADGERDITQAAEEYWGRGVSFAITILYFFAIYPICLAYGVGITNTFANFFIYQLGLTSLFDPTTMTLYPWIRAVLSAVLVALMTMVMFLKEELITKACNMLVYPLCAVLFAFSLYLIPHWKLESVSQIGSLKDFLVTVWLTLPVLVFAFNHSPAISTFTMSVKRRYPQNAHAKSNQILFNTTIMLVSFTMFFVFSCILCLDVNDFSAARAANIPILSYFADKFDNNLISYGAPLVAFLAIASSFFGHYFGAYEGLNGIIRKGIKMSGNERPNVYNIKKFSTTFMLVTIIIVAYVNPSILDFIENLGGPIIAAILFVMPIVAIYSVKKLHKHKNLVLDGFVLLTGLLTISSVVYKMMI
ncbi:aromatic amino acid transport family protein [Campylobacter hyointestinalis]|uniref:aromatic amino acid transport family protein n=1 Tax=Campylobacter hyointestinalis TaxID=198 RepID=UPI0011ABF56E|nr:aromatic amino acid transport family protein [Campylobacter hyointestinalis]TWO29583.1 HAAAP family serine/threonine permease [Campylobacter hyointestinalis]